MRKLIAWLFGYLLACGSTIAMLQSELVMRTAKQGTTCMASIEKQGIQFKDSETRHSANTYLPIVLLYHPRTYPTQLATYSRKSSSFFHMSFSLPCARPQPVVYLFCSLGLCFRPSRR